MLSLLFLSTLPFVLSSPTSKRSSIPVAPFSAAIAGKVSRPSSFISRYEAKIYNNKPWYSNTKRSKTAGKIGSGKGTVTSYTASLDGTDGDVEYIVNVTIGTPGQHLTAIVDTGSSDPWLVAKGFTCYNYNDEEVPEAECYFGGVYDPSKSSTWKEIPDVNLNITYGDGEFVAGPVGTETITIAGLTVPKQEFGAPDIAYWEGDTINSGIIGLAYPELTSVYPGTIPSQDNYSDWLPYNPFFFSAVADGLVEEPYFSVALNRGSYDQQLDDIFDAGMGYLSFGGIAPVPVTDTTVTVANSKYDLTNGEVVYLWYTVEADYIFTGSTKIPSSDNPSYAILDTGTTLNYVPNDVAELYNSLFVPAAVYNESYWEAYIVPCDAKVPAFDVKIGGVTFSIDTADQLLPAEDENGYITCITGTQPGGTVADGDIFILGDVFLHNVVLTNNINTNEITLTQREAYSS